MTRARSAELTPASLLARSRWTPLPSVCVLYGDADFFKREVEERFARELAAACGEISFRRYTPADREAGRPSLAEVLDELRTPSFLAQGRLIAIEAADPFLAAHREALEPFVGQGFSGGHLILSLEAALDQRTRFAKAVAEKGWAVNCQKPFDRPPPWQPDADPWDSDLCRWVAARAKQKKVEMDLELAYAFCQRVGDDLATLDEELEKLRTWLGKAGARADLAAITAVTGELREDSIFDLVDAFLAADRPAAFRILRRILRGGYHPPRGTPVLEPVGISSLFIGALVSRFRALRRGHALAAEGKGPDAWVAMRLTPRPFIARFTRDLRTTPPSRIARSLAALRALDRAVKTGSRAEPLLEDFVLRH